MKELSNPSKNQYNYYCDRCGTKISFKDKNMFQLFIKIKYDKSYKLCDLCNRCYKSLERGVFKKKGE